MSIVLLSDGLHGKRAIFAGNVRVHVGRKEIWTEVAEKTHLICIFMIRSCFAEKLRTESGAKDQGSLKNRLLAASNRIASLKKE